jgi:predicted ribosomally synthesized peptide with SipW-like signal peptide
VKRNMKLFVTLVVGVSVMGIIGVGTYATFTAQVANPGNKFATGTLVLSDTKEGGSTCYSTGGGSTDTNVNNNCDTLLNLTVQKPGDNGFANVTIATDGSLDASDLQLYTAGCTGADAVGESYHGTGNPCSSVEFYVQQWTDSDFTGASTCVYGGGTATTCAFNTSKTLGDFATTYGSSTPYSFGAQTSGTELYFTVAMQLPGTAGNSLQGRQATINFTWFATQ